VPNVRHQFLKIRNQEADSERNRFEVLTRSLMDKGICQPFYRVLI